VEKPRQGMPVTPGDYLGVEEEYFPGYGAYIDDYGNIRSQLVGRVLIDIVKRTIEVRQVKGKPIIPKPGDIVLGVVETVSNDLAFIRIYNIENKPSRSTDFTGVLHISQVSNDYVETMYDVLRLGDVVRAKVLNSLQPFQLNTKHPSFGVVVAFCSKCGEILKLKDDKLVCPACGSVEKRKISTKYYFRW